jgi:hypothetical protein
MTFALTKKACLIFAGLIGLLPVTGTAGQFESPGILILGDSQITFGSGPVLLDFFENLTAHCEEHVEDDAGSEAMSALDELSVGIIGVRSTSLHSWTARSGRAKGSLCDVDPKWHVNAGTFGILNKTRNKYVQIGRGAAHQMCHKGQSGFEAMFKPDYYTPALVVMSFLGNSSDRWARDASLALRDVRRTMQDLPPDLPCVFMTSAPAHEEKVNRKRFRAQENIRSAFEVTGQRCAFVPGFTPETMAKAQDNPHFFRRRPSGAVKDPYHPNGSGAAAFIAQRAPVVCEAVASQTRGKTIKAPVQRPTLRQAAFTAPPPRPRLRPTTLSAPPMPRPRMRPAHLLLVADTGAKPPTAQRPPPRPGVRPPHILILAPSPRPTPAPQPVGPADAPVEVP